MSMGFQNIGFEIQAGFDNWDAAVRNYRLNFSHPVHKVDIANLEAIDQIIELKPRVIIGGPPCQDFSIAGYDNLDPKRANLTLCFADYVTHAKPEWFVMENVYNIAKKPILAEVIQVFAEAGYGLTSKILNASYVGVPQTRKRFFLIGHLGSKDDFLHEILDRNQTKTKTTVFDYLQNELGLEHYYVHPRNYKRRGIFSIHEPSSTIRGTNRPIPKNYKRHHGDTADIDDKIRALTARERSRLQTFPKNFKFEGSKSEVNQLIGNAVPVKMAEYVARCMIEYNSTLNGLR